MSNMAALKDNAKRPDLQPMAGRDAGDASAWCDWGGAEQRWLTMWVESERWAIRYWIGLGFLAWGDYWRW